MEAQSLTANSTTTTAAAAGRPHPPLDLGSQQIRLLSFTPDRNLKLETFDKLDRPSYLALSYEWGPQEPTETIRLNGFPFVIRRNLHLALAAIQRNKIVSSSVHQPQPGTDPAFDGHTAKNHSNYFWVDALCIDQDNIAERGHQVGLMADIYSNASFVIVWLGPDLDPSFEAIRNRQPDAAGGAFKKILMGHWRSINHDSGLLDTLFRNSYWSRLWVVQEFLLARDIVFVSDSKVLEWDILQSKTLWHIEMSAMFDAPELRFASLLIQQKLSGDKGSSTLTRVFMALVAKYRNHSCSDVRDKVCSLIDVAQELGHFNITQINADYSLTPAELFDVMESNFSKNYHSLFVRMMSSVL